jgi:hypothetical protein
VVIYAREAGHLEPDGRRTETIHAVVLDLIPDKMPTTLRQKACLACTKAKRKCDKALPECERCVEYDIECVYPERHRRRRDRPPPATENPADALESTLSNIEPSAERSEFVSGLLSRNAHVFPPPTITPTTSAVELTNWIGSVDLGSLPPTASPICAVLPLDSGALPSGFSTSEPRALEPIAPPKTGINLHALHDKFSWFLSPETWTIEHRSAAEQSAVQIHPPVSKIFVKGIKAILAEWVRTGSNSFIHARLYTEPPGLPPCLQDAFTTLATYDVRTEATEDLILKIATDRASALVAAFPVVGEDVGTPPRYLEYSELKTIIARVQALLVYQVIALFDGDVRSRAHAEGLIPIIFSWSEEMLRACTTASITAFFTGGCVTSFPSSISASTELALQTTLWQAWILAESVRRTWLVVSATMNVYLIMRDGWVQCRGGVHFTMRKGLWEASSATEWMRAWNEDDVGRGVGPLFGPSMSSGAWMVERVEPADVDDFARHFLYMSVSTDRLERWLGDGEGGRQKWT